jgi:hypothetical protein
VIGQVGFRTDSPKPSEMNRLADPRRLREASAPGIVAQSEKLITLWPTGGDFTHRERPDIHGSEDGGDSLDHRAGV